MTESKLLARVKEKQLELGVLEFDLKLGQLKNTADLKKLRKEKYLSENNRWIDSWFNECARSKELDLRIFEKKLGHKIQLFTKPKITLLPAHLLNTVVNGIKLKRYFTVK